MDEQKKADYEQPFPIGVPVIYTNGVLVTLTVADISLTITVNGQPTHLLNMSLTTAKTLVSNLTKALNDFQDKTNTKVLEIREIASLMNKDNK